MAFGVTTGSSFFYRIISSSYFQFILRSVQLSLLIQHFKSVRHWHVLDEKPIVVMNESIR